MNYQSDKKYIYIVYRVGQISVLMSQHFFKNDSKKCPISVFNFRRGRLINVKSFRLMPTFDVKLPRMFENLSVYFLTINNLYYPIKIYFAE